MALIRGNSLDNILNGTNDDDTFIGLGGNDTLIGGGGADTAWYSGNLAGYSFSNVEGHLMVRDISSVDGSDGVGTLTAIEKLQFGNAQLSPASEFRVNTYTAVDQTAPSITALDNGGFVVSWQSYGQDGDQLGIYGQRYDVNGVAVGTEFQVNTYTTGHQDHPTIAALSDGGFVVSWVSRGQEDGSGIYAQRYDSNGVATGTEFRVNTYTAFDQTAPSIATFNDGGFVVSWMSRGQEAGSGIYAQLYDANGVATGTEFRVNTFTSSWQYEPSITALDNGGFVVSWQSDGQDGSLSGIYGQRYDANGVKAGAEFRVNTYTLDQQIAPTIAALSDGGFVVSWTSGGQDGPGSSIYGQRYDANGVQTGAEFQVNTHTTTYQNAPSIAAFNDGGFVVSWMSRGQDFNNDIYVQRYDANGVATGTEFQVNTYEAESSSFPTIAALSDGSFVVSWQSVAQDGSFSGIYAKHYDADGSAVGLTKLTGTAGADVINLDAGQLLIVDGAGGNDTINGSSGEDVLLGRAGSDTLRGNGGNDSLDGGTGADNMAGGFGDDIYIVDRATDIVSEAVGAGNDTINSSVTRTLGANLENLTLTGSSNINGTGNAMGNLIEGNSGNNVLNGKAGADILLGGYGDDTYIVDNEGDVAIDININGNNNSSGTDIVKSSVTFDLSAGGIGIENLTLTGTKAISGYGNDQDNTITGNAAANTLFGADGADTLNGGLGNDLMLGGNGGDTYIVNSSKDVVFESLDEGYDVVISSVSYTLPSNVEDLLLTGVAAINGTGNDFDNILVGNAAANTLSGLDGNDVLLAGAGNDKLLGGNGNDDLSGSTGNDILVGGTGADNFHFNTALNTSTNVDKVMDFSHAEGDFFMLSDSVFAALGAEVTEDEIRCGAGITNASTADQHLIYNSTTGNLYYDADGAGGAAAKLFATISLYGLATSHPDTLTSSDFGVFTYDFS